MKILKFALILMVLLAGYIGLAIYAMSIVPQMTFKSNLSVGEFFRRSQSHDYNGAHQLLSRRLQAQMSAQTLAQQWRAFESAHGPIKNWMDAPGGVFNIWPRSVTGNRTVSGRKSGSGLVTTQLVPEGNSWRIDRLTIAP